MLERTFIPTKPFPDFKWKWASLQCTESINDPVILLGVLFRMRSLELQNRRLKFSSPEFANEMQELQNDLVGTNLTVNLAERVGTRNIMRNSGQYWKALGLIPTNTMGKIELTEFGRRVADRDISQTEFAAIIIQTLRLPNRNIQSAAECQTWLNAGIDIHPLKLLLSIMLKLVRISPDQAFITPEELVRIVIPLSGVGVNAELDDYVNFIIWYRTNEISLIGWPNCVEGANDFRIAREFLIFLSKYGYVDSPGDVIRTDEHYHINLAILDEITEIVNHAPVDETLQNALNQIRQTEVIAEFERIRVRNHTQRRPNQAQFRRNVLAACERCIITNVTMPEILEAAHIKPHAYHGDDSIENGFALRVDIHTLFDAGHLRISPDGVIELSNRARMDYGAVIPPRIVIPDFTNRDFLRWRWENYNGL